MSEDHDAGAGGARSEQETEMSDNAVPAITHPELKAALTNLEQRMTIKGAAGLVLLGSFLTALKFFG